jgi:hypothetical protein
MYTLSLSLFLSLSFSLSLSLSLSLTHTHAQVENDLGPAVFPNALIVGDCIITDLLGQFLLVY